MTEAWTFAWACGGYISTLCADFDTLFMELVAQYGAPDSVTASTAAMPQNVTKG
jgi:hypothetical protein